MNECRSSLFVTLCPAAVGAFEETNIKMVFHPHPIDDRTVDEPCKRLFKVGVPGVYHVPCSCGQCYIGQTGHTIAMHCKKQHYLWLGQEEKSALTAHGWKTRHKILFSHMERIFQLTVEIGGGGLSSMNHWRFS